MVTGLARATTALLAWTTPFHATPGLRLVYEVAFLALLIALGAQAKAHRTALDAALLVAVGAVLATGVLTLLIAQVPLEPAHDHNTFIARADCAWNRDCTVVPRGAWGLPSMAAYGLFLRVLPYRLLSLSVVSLAFTALDAALLVALVRALATRTTLRAHAPVAGALAGLFLVSHPAFARVAAADTPWPFALACLLAAALSAVGASEPDARPWEASVALVAFGFAMTSNHVFMVLGPMVLLAPWAWSSGPFRPRASVVPGLLLWALLLTPSALDVAQNLLQRREHLGQATRLSDGLGLFVPGARETILYFDARVTPPSWSLLCLLGLGVALWRPMMPFVMVALAWFVTEVPLGGQVPLDGGYPTRYVHGFTSHFFAATFAALGAVTVLAYARRWWPLAAVLLSLAALLPWPRSREAVAFARERRPLSLEARAVSSAFDRLPPCDVLVVPPEIQDDMGCARRGSDPVEAVFQTGELRWVYAHRGLRVPEVVQADGFTDAMAQGRRVLFYEGSVYHTFIPCEFREGRIPPSRERPLLTRFRERFTLTPVHTFTIPTAQHRFAEMRVMAAVGPSLTLGFYWLRPRTIATTPQGDR